MSRNFYNDLFAGNLDEIWNEAPGKLVLFNYIKRNYLDTPIKLIDIGCGSGYFANRIKLLNENSQIFGFDYSEEAIKKAIDSYGDVIFFTEDVHNPDWVNRGPFDLAISYGCFEHFEKPSVALKNLYNSLRDGGEFLLMIPTLGHYRNDRFDEGWYEDFNVPPQMQWNFKRETWEALFSEVGLELYSVSLSGDYGAINSGNFYFGKK